MSGTLLPEVTNALRTLLLIVLTLTAAACGGGGGDGGSGGSGTGDGGGSGTGNGGTGSTWRAGVYQPSSSFAAKCVAPRAGTPDVTGTVTDQNNWLRSWTNELYLWYLEVPDLNPALYQTADYFDRLKTPALSSSGQSKDKFHFTYDTDEWVALSQSGEQSGYGLSWALLSATPPRRAVIAYMEPNPPTATVNANLARGVEVLTVDGEDLVNVNTQAGVDVLNAGLFPTGAGQSHTFTVRDVGSSATRSVTLQSAQVVTSPVQNVRTLATAGGTVGYMLFNDHIATAEGALIDAVNTLRAAQITDLVLDIRYNGGGYLDIAAELAYMIAGPTATAGQTFELAQFNDKYPNMDPVTGEALTPTPFHSATQGIMQGLAAGQVLPSLQLPRVFVLTGSDTCSASESIINGLRGVNVQVIQIGSTTCGKPYGFYPTDNCGTTYFSIQFRGVNAKGFGDYTDGFSPANSVGTAGSIVPGCSVADDFTHALGDPDEGRLATALSYRMTQSCATGPTGMLKPLAVNALSGVEKVVVPKSPWLQNRILRH